MGLETQHQYSHETRLNRFPKIFTTSVELRPKAKRILSFGCATGEECFTLAEYFPKAEIVGVDIDKQSIQQAKTNNKYPKQIGFINNIENAGKFDIIFCLMVFFSIFDNYQFDAFDKAISELVKNHLRKRGMLVIYTAKYDVMTTEGGKTLTAMREWTHKHNKDQKDYFDGYYEKK